VTLNFYNNISTSAVLLDVEKAFDAAWHLLLLHNFSKLKFSISLIKLIGSFLSQRKFRGDSDESVISTQRDTQAGVSQESVLSTTLYSVHIYIYKSLC
jgi:hypothetical protein